MKRFISLVAASLLAVLLTADAPAQTLSVAISSNVVSTGGATLHGAVTATNLVGAATNAVSLRVFWGGSDGGTSALAWPVSGAVTGTYTNNQAWSYPITGMTAGRVVNYQVRATDLAGSVWLAASGAFTTTASAATTPDTVWREAVRGGTGTLSRVTINGTNYTAGIATIVDTSGATNKVLKLTP